MDKTIKAEVKKRKVGRKKKYGTAEELHAKVLEYMEKVPNKTMSGLALFLGFSRSDNFQVIKKHGDDYAEVVDFARLLVENAYEEKLHGPQCTGAIFALKHLSGWSDKTTVTHETDKPLVFEVYKDE